MDTRCDDVKGVMMYKVNVGTQGVLKCHVNQMLTRPESVSQQTAVNIPGSPPLLLA